MRVFITGIAGFLGRHLARALMARGHQVAGSYIGAPPAGLGEVALAEADLEDRAALRRAVTAADAEVVVHLAALSHVGESWSQVGAYFRVNVLGTENLLAAAAGRRFVFASTSEVYGAVAESEQPLREERTVDPRTPYALTKAAAELLALRQGATVARSFNLVGPGQAASFALPDFALQLAAIRRGEQEAVLHVGSLTPRRDFVHVEDGAEAYAVLVERGEPGATYNLATGRAHSIREALESLLAVAGVAARITEDPQRLRPVDIPLLCGDAARLRALGWEPRHTLADAMRDLWTSVAGSELEGARRLGAS
jgi:GDP-4-dehydro-6-deoxy-D-mannose reductase